MRIRIRIVNLAIFLLLLVPLSAHAQVVVAVEVNHSSSDLMGQLLVYHFKEGIRASQAMRLAGPFEEHRLVVNLVTVNIGIPINPELGTAFAVTWTYNLTSRQGALYGFFLNQTGGWCGSDRIEDTAGSLVAQTDRVISGLIESLSEIHALMTGQY